MSIYQQIAKNLITLSALVFLSACSISVRGDVSSFHYLPEPSGESIAIVPMSLSQQADSLEFQEYAGQVRRQLVMLGYTTASKEDADLIVELGYGAKRERGSRRSPFRMGMSFGYNDPWYGYGYGYYNWYYWRHNAFFYSNYYDPFYRPWGHNNFDQRLYAREFKLDIREAGGDKIFEGRVESLGRTKNLPKVIPLMIEAMFVDFPGESGAVKQVVVREEENQK